MSTATGKVLDPNSPREQLKNPKRYAALKADLRRSCSRFLGDNDDEIDEVVAETFLKAWQCIDNFRGESSLKTWLVSIAMNECRHLFRYRSCRPWVQFNQVSSKLLEEPDNIMNSIDFLESVDPSPFDLVLRREFKETRDAALSSLHRNLRYPATLYFVEKKSMKEIAVLLNITELAVKSRLHRVYLRLRQPPSKRRQNFSEHGPASLRDFL